MKYLVDTHVLLWFTIEPRRLSGAATQVLTDERSVLLWSQASTWEMAIKVGLGKLTLPGPLRAWLPQRVAELRMTSLPITDQHAFDLAELPQHHRDPFDRMLVAQARAEAATLLTADPILGRYDVPVLW